MNAKFNFSKQFFISLLKFTIIMGLFNPSLTQDFSNRRIEQLDKNGVIENYAQLPLSFEANNGIADSDVKFISRSNGFNLFLMPTEIMLSLRESRNSKQDQMDTTHSSHSLDQALGDNILRIKFVGSNVESQLLGVDELPGRVNYFIGNDPTKWSSNLPTFSRVINREVYPLVDIIYYGKHGEFEYDFVVAPGGEPDNIVLEFQGSDKLEIDTNGDLLISLADEQVRMRSPYIYQEIDDDRIEIQGKYELISANLVKFEIGNYSRDIPLVIDPVLIYSTYLGGDSFERSVGIVVDEAGNVFVTGFTQSGNFPISDSGQPLGDVDVFVTKLDSTGNILLYSTYIGGSNYDESMDIKVDGTGNAYIIGNTNSNDFPATFSFTSNVNSVFVLKLNDTGDTILYSTLLGGDDITGAGALAVDLSGNVYTTGITAATDFPTLNAFQPTLGTYDGRDCFPGSRFDAFVTKLNETGDALIYSTYLGGNNIDWGADIAVDNNGNAYVFGPTCSTDFPVANPYQGIFGGGIRDVFVTKFSPEGDQLVFSTYLGGSEHDDAGGIAIDTSGNVYVTGVTISDDFPLVNPLQTSLGGSYDIFVTKFVPLGNLVSYSTYLGGGGNDSTSGIVVDSTGSVYIAGGTDTADFPLVNNIQTYGGLGGDALVAKISPDGNSLVYSTYLGGGPVAEEVGGEYAWDIAVDTSGNAYVTGESQSLDFPTKNPIQSILADCENITPEDCPFQISGDLFITKISIATDTPEGNNTNIELVDSASGMKSISLTFAEIVASGITEFTTGEDGPTPPVGFSLGNSPVFYDIVTTAIYSSPITVCIAYDSLQYENLGNLRLLHYENSSWTDITVSHNIDTYTICGEVENLSPFVIAEILPFAFSGFFQPVDNLPTLNVVNAGKAIPIKFSIDGFYGLNIFPAGYPTSTSVICGTTAEDAVEVTMSASSSGLSYNANTDQYIYVWKTNKTWAGSCRTLVIKLIDGTYHRANFKFK